jgi:hypothetical protein
VHPEQQEHMLANLVADEPLALAHARAADAAAAADPDAPPALRRMLQQLRSAEQQLHAGVESARGGGASGSSAVPAVRLCLISSSAAVGAGSSMGGQQQEPRWQRVASDGCEAAGWQVLTHLDVNQWFVPYTAAAAAAADDGEDAGWQPEMDDVGRRVLAAAAAMRRQREQQQGLRAPAPAAAGAGGAPACLPVHALHGRQLFSRLPGQAVAAGGCSWFEEGCDADLAPQACC